MCGGAPPFLRHPVMSMPWWTRSTTTRGFGYGLYRRSGTLSAPSPAGAQLHPAGRVATNGNAWIWQTVGRAGHAGLYSERGRRSWPGWCQAMLNGGNLQAASAFTRSEVIDEFTAGSAQNAQARPRGLGFERGSSFIGPRRTRATQRTPCVHAGFNRHPCGHEQDQQDRTVIFLTNKAERRLSSRTLHLVLTAPIAACGEDL